MVKIVITGTALIGLALFAFLCLATGVSFNEIISGLGNALVAIGAIAGVVLIILAIYAATR